MKRLQVFTKTVLIAALFAAVLPGFGSIALAAGPPTVAVAVTGTPTPGATVTAKATVTINDGSALQSIAWKLVDGVNATVTNATTDTITIVLPDRKTFRNHLMEILEEPPVTDAKLPANVPPNPNYEGGLQNRWVLAGVAPHALTEAGTLTFDITIVTSSGTYHSTQAVAAKLPFTTSTGLRNVPTSIPVLVHGKTQASYNWALTVPTGSTATLSDATTQNPEFTPDVAGTYKLTVTDLATGSATSFNVVAGKWKGIITGQDAKGRPTVDAACKTCHVGTLELFTPWANSGHAEIFSQNMNTPAGHYAASCLGCHTVGYSATALNNNGVSDQADFKAFNDSGLMAHGDAANWTTVLSKFPATAKLSNIQCENCHGPQDSAAHTQGSPRLNLSSDVCGSCHGEPARHGRFQQWQLSGHANYELAVEEGTNGDCAKCHSAQGFVQWQDKGFSTAALNITWTTEDVHPQTCATCHDPHAVGTTSGGPTTDATVRVSGTTPLLLSGYTATNVGRAGVCMTCHNGRRGLKDDANFNTADLSRAPHEGPQADILMGQNLFLTKVGTRGFHALVADSCVTCHMEATPPPAELSYQLGGTNHTFYASATICSKCHTSITAESIQGPVTTKMTNLKTQLEKVLKTAIQAQIRAGNTIDLGSSRTIKYAADLKTVEFTSASGRQGVNLTLANGTKYSSISLANVKAVRPGGSSVEILATVDPIVAKAGWNYFMVNNDKSKGVHNPAFVNSALDVALFGVSAINTAATTPIPGGNSPAAIGGGLGNGAGAVSCTTPYVYWTEIAGHIPGNAGSQWRTDVIARNLSGTAASLKFYLHQSDGTNLSGTGSVPASGQKAFEDLVATFGAGNNMGSLEICSDQPLLVNGRIFNQAANGTFGQNLDGKVADVGYSAGQTVNLIGLRQNTDLYRTNLSVTNAGTIEAQVSISLFDSTGLVIKTYTLTVPAGQVVQDNEPFKTRANTPDIGWGYATVTILKGSNIHTSASFIDSRTNDPTTVNAKQ